MTASEQAPWRPSSERIPTPKPMRETTDSEGLSILLDEDGGTRLDPPPILAGSMADYAATAPRADESETAWEAEVRARHWPE